MDRLLSERAVIEALQHWTALEEWKKDFKGFINELSMPEDDYYGIMQYIDEAPNEATWIPVSERLPQINEWVLCQCRVGYKVLRLTSYGCYCTDTQVYMDSFVIAWMPLPKPYEPPTGK